MGLSNQDEMSPGDEPLNGHDEESLPLYSSHFDIVEPETLKLPEMDAPPDEVRDFLIQLLAGRRRLPVDHARRTASKWTTGSGRELRKYSPTMFLTMFGAEDGWLLYKEVKMFEHRIDQQIWSHRYRLPIVVASSFTWSVIMSLICYFVRDPVWVLVGGFLGLLIGVFACGTSCLVCCLSPGKEDEIEGELRRAWATPQQGAAHFNVEVN